MALKPRQLQLVEALLANPMRSDVEIARELGINNKTVGVWRKLPEFQEEMKVRLADKWKDAERAAQQTMIKLNEEGDFRAAKYILDSLGYAAPVVVEADISSKIVINITDEEEGEEE